MFASGRFGVYIHIPYCLQRCTYCDFATYEQSKILPPEKYAQLLFEEIRQKISHPNSSLQNKTADTIYFGGGTPSLIPAEIIVSILSELEKQGLKRNRDAEVTLEINPATVDTKKMEIYLKAGVNRFSVGAQTFDDALLKMVHREHNAHQTRETLKLLQTYKVNYSFDILFALPHQSLALLNKDLEEVLSFSPPHVSPYCLTVPEGHALTKDRPLEETQLEMFSLISQTLLKSGYERYEISNFSKPGFESKHNSLYWDDSEYLGLGLSAHSYSHLPGRWGARYWNASSIGEYEKQIQQNWGQQHEFPYQNLTHLQCEELKSHQALTDFCYTFLRTRTGLSTGLLSNKFGPESTIIVENSLLELTTRGWVKRTSGHWQLTEEGIVVSNQVFAALTFLEGELAP